MEREILLLGDPGLYEISEEVRQEELESLGPVFTDMFDCIKGIRRDYGFGRAIAGSPDRGEETADLHVD